MYSDVNVADVNVADLNVADLNVADVNVADVNVAGVNVANVNVADVNVADLNVFRRDAYHFLQFGVPRSSRLVCFYRTKITMPPYLLLIILKTRLGPGCLGIDVNRTR
ncbi:hypothetical protein BgiBS90_031342 [Biomphalaria glabrata]|nr:hypothetical protein BgiBS90_031342 [Biomphalaria glabrata]